MNKFLAAAIFLMATFQLAPNVSIAGDEKMVVTMKECGNSTDQAGIKKALECYVNAGMEGDSKIAARGFAPTATMSWSENGKMQSVPIKALFDYFDEKKRPASCEVTDCNIAGDIAMVRVESEFDGAKFTDMFTLVKDGNDWKIVSKVYQVKQ